MNKNHDPLLFLKSIDSLKKLHALYRLDATSMFEAKDAEEENEYYPELNKKRKIVKSSSTEKQNRFTELEYFTVLVDNNSSVEKGLKKLGSREYRSEILFVCSTESIDVRTRYAAMVGHTTNPL